MNGNNKSYPAPKRSIKMLGIEMNVENSRLIVPHLDGSERQESKLIKKVNNIISQQRGENNNTTIYSVQHIIFNTIKDSGVIGKKELLSQTTKASQRVVINRALRNMLQDGSLVYLSNDGEVQYKLSNQQMLHKYQQDLIDKAADGFFNQNLPTGAGKFNLSEKQHKFLDKAVYIVESAYDLGVIGLIEKKGLIIDIEFSISQGNYIRVGSMLKDIESEALAKAKDNTAKKMDEDSRAYQIMKKNYL